MDDMAKLLWERFDRIETKVDMLLAQHWKRVGISIATSFIFSILFAIIIAFIEKH